MLLIYKVQRKNHFNILLICCLLIKKMVNIQQKNGKYLSLYKIIIFYYCSFFFCLNQSIIIIFNIIKYLVKSKSDEKTAEMNR